MKYFGVLCIIFCLYSVKTKAQEVDRGNPVLYAEIIMGGSRGKAGGLSAGAEMNFQAKRALFSARLIGNVRLSTKAVLLTPITPFPVIEQSSSLEEIAALYGWRFITRGRSMSFSAGVSHNLFQETYRGEDGENLTSRSAYLGFPVEANIKWFKQEKQRFRIYGLLPVGKPTSFGGSLGLKVFGNISRHSYCGLAVVYGLGFHKKY